jgi:hypothetical protein
MIDPQAYGPEIAGILALPPDEARAAIRRSKLPKLVRAGLYLHFNYWEEAHELAQDVETPDGSYWHGIVHRQEPDAANAGYWFRRVGEHSIFPALRARAAELGYRTGATWDPIAFIDYCENARAGSPEEQIAKEVQRAEWELLFDHCAAQAKPGAAQTS